MIYEQYQAIKRVHADAVLLMQVGDFYQAFSTDARTLAAAIGATCRRVSFGKRRVDTCGVPAALLDTTIQALLGRGHKVAIAQPASPKEAKGKTIERVVSDARITVQHDERKPST